MLHCTLSMRLNSHLLVNFGSEVPSEEPGIWPLRLNI